MGMEGYEQNKEGLTVKQSLENELRILRQKIEEKTEKINALKENIKDDETLALINEIFDEYNELTAEFTEVSRKLVEYNSLGDDDVEEV